MKRLPVGSLTGRLLLASMLLLPLFLGSTGLYLERAHRFAIEAAQEERLQSLILTLLAEAEYESALTMPVQLLEPRLNQPDSGLYAFVSSKGIPLWSSPSVISIARPLKTPELSAGERHFSRRAGMFEQAYKVVWETNTGTEIPLLFSVIEAADGIAAQLNSYRRSLLFWLGGAALLLVGCQWVVLSWGLRPLQQLASQVAAIEAGERDSLSGPYPQELQSVTDNLNTLLSSEKRRRQRVRNTLADLAHSLKTPLAIIRNANPSSESYRALVSEQSDHMEKIVSYQLQRAVGGTHQLLKVVAVAPLLERLRSTLLKVYSASMTDIDLHVAPECLFRGDERDLMEVMGNLMDNACKYGHHLVRVSASSSEQYSLQIRVEDDGEGIPARLQEELLQRGARGDMSVSGHGIGLAVAADIIADYQGELTISQSALGGACISVTFI